MKLLWINCRVLHPLIGGDRIRTYQMLKALKEHHEIVYVCLRTTRDTPESIQQASEYCHRIEPVPHPDRQEKGVSNQLRLGCEALFSPHPLISTKYDSPALRRKIVDLAGGADIDLVICDYLAPMINFLGEVRDRIEAPLVLFHHNVESEIWRRHREHARNPALRWLYHLQWRRTRRLEERSAALVDGQITVSENDRGHFADERHMKNVLGAVPTGVDFEAFQPNPDAREPATVAFLGAMDWHANIDAVTWFTQEILPRIRKRKPEVRFLIIGRNPAERILALAESDPNIEVTGTVDDVLPFLQRAAAMVLPLRVGGGTRIKVYEAVAAGVPVVSTAVGVEGLDLEPVRHFRLADDSEAFADQTVAVLENPTAAEKVAADALDHIASRYRWSAIGETFMDLCRYAVSPGQSDQEKQS